MDQFGNVSIVSVQNANWKGGSLCYAKKCQFMYLGPHNTGHFGKMGVSANQRNLARFGNFSTHSLTKSKLKGGSIFRKKLPTHFGHTMHAVFKQMGLSAYQPKLYQFLILSTIFGTKSKFREGIFYRKNWHLVYVGPMFLSNTCLPTGQI